MSGRTTSEWAPVHDTNNDLCRNSAEPAAAGVTLRVSDSAALHNSFQQPAAALHVRVLCHLAFMSSVLFQIYV